MFLPIGDSPNPEGFTPFVTWGIIAANVAVFFFFNVPLGSTPIDPSAPMLADYVRMLVSQGVPVGHIPAVLANSSMAELLLFAHGYKPAAPSVLNLLTSLFLHAGFVHLAGNMLFLYIYGDNVEHQMGRIKFLLMYLATGIVATLSFAVLAGDSMAPLVGASGAISGVLGCYFLMFPRNVVKVFILLFPIFMHVVRVPARLVLGLYVLLDNLLPILTQATSNVAYGAHLGGFFGGLGIAALGEYFGWRLPFRTGKRSPTGTAAGKSSRGRATESLFNALQRAMDNNDPAEVLVALKNSTRREVRALGGERTLAIAVFLKNNGLHEYAIRLLKTTLTGQQPSPLLAEIYYELGDNRLRQGFTTAAYQHFLTALECNPDRRTEQLLKTQLQRIAT